MAGVAGLVLLVLLGRSWLFPGGDGSGMSPDLTVSVPAPPPPFTAYDTLRSGETLGEMLAAAGLAPDQAYSLTRAVRTFRSPRSLRPGVVARFEGRPGGSPDHVWLRINPDSALVLASSDSGWTARVHTVPVTVDTLLLAGRINSSLWAAELSGQVDELAPGEFQEYVFDLADVFAWKVDFTRDIREGDAFRVAIERERRPDGSLRTRRFLAIELLNRGKDLRAIPFTRPDGGRREYFDPDGEAMRGVFLRYPVPFRVTSGFSRRRFHPVLKRSRPHLGIDYGAPYGTPVKATAAGVVTRAGTWGGYGRMIEIRHVKGISTRYAHLSAIASGIRVGVRVDQGQVIGRVGQSGLATGPHLHYEFLQGGQHRNPATVDLPSAEALEKRYMEAFDVRRDAALALLGGVPLPAEVPAPELRAQLAD